MTWLVLAVMAGLAWWVWLNPGYFPALLIFAFPLEMSREWFPAVPGLDKLGEFVGVIDAGRIVMLLLLAYSLFYLIGPGRRDLAWLGRSFRPGQALAAYILAGGLSILWSVDPVKTVAGAGRLILLLALGISVFLVLVKKENPAGPWLVPLSFSIMSSVLALVGIFEAATKHFIWYGTVYRLAGRINATFMDANIYARFLIIGLLASMILFVKASGIVRKGTLLLGAALQAGALLVSGSRTGWFAAAVVLVILAILVRRKSLLLVLLLGVLASTAAVLKNPAVLKRLLELKAGFWQAATARGYLLKSGVDMFVNHPVLGVGLGGFQHVLLTQYADLMNRTVSLSHTALVTTAAELGTLGLLITALVFFYLYRSLPPAGHDRRLQAIFAVLSITAIFISAQGEGRFFEDTSLWVLMGYLAAIHRRAGSMEGGD